VHLKLGNHEAAESDASAVLSSEPGNVKAMLRRAAAREGLEKVGEAVADYEAARKLEPANKVAAEALARIMPSPSPPPQESL
jgi:Flp pilus assembly protein TadD